MWRSSDMDIQNLFENLPDAADEVIDILCNSDGVKIERIVSRGQSTPPGEWYDQQSHEWVVLLEGQARLRFENGDRTIEMSKGDHVFIAAHERHRVEWTDPKTRSVWLAVHIGTTREKPSTPSA